MPPNRHTATPNKDAKNDNESHKNGAVTTPGIDVSEHEGHATLFSWMRFSSGVRVKFRVSSVSGYAHVFIYSFRCQWDPRQKPAYNSVIFMHDT